MTPYWDNGTVRVADLYSGAGGSAYGIYLACQDAGIACHITGFDLKYQPHYPSFHNAGYAKNFSFVLQDALTVDLTPFDAVWASPPCQGYSIMNNLPWLVGKERPLLILPTIEKLDCSGKPYVVENVMGARYGAKGLAKRGLEAHGLIAGWLCGTMFGLPFYRHRLFASSLLWLAPEHPKHSSRILAGRNLGERQHNVVFSRTEDARGNVHQSFSVRAASPIAAPIPNGNFDRWRASGDPMAALMGKMGTLGKWQNSNGAQAAGVGHAKGWRLAAEAMGIDWMRREELTQAIPPVYSRFVWRQLIEAWRRM